MNLQQLHRSGWATQTCCKRWRVDSSEELPGVLVVVGHEVVVMECWGSGAWAVRMGGAESSFRQEKAPLP